MCRPARLLVTFILALLPISLPCAAFAVPPLAAELASTDRIGISGCKQFPPEKLLAALQLDREFLLAADPATPLDQFLEVVCERLTAGYQRAGYADAVVQAHADLRTRRILVMLDEGRRYKCGPVRLLGKTRLRQDQLVRWLTTPHPLLAAERRTGWELAGGLTISDKAGEEPLWLPGKTARFDAWSRQQLIRQVHLAMAEQGLFFPRLKIHAQPAQQPGLAELVVEVLDDGPPGVIGPVEVVGAKKNTPEAVLQFLEVKQGQPLSRAELARLQSRLHESARFTNYSVRPHAPEKQGGPVTLRIELVEMDDAPELGRPFSPEERALLKLREWLIDEIGSGKSDLVLSMCDTSAGVRRLTAVVSATGSFARVDVSSPSISLGSRVFFKVRALTGLAPDPEAEPDAPCLMAIDLSPDLVGLYTPLLGRKYVTQPGEKTVSANLKLGPAKDPEHKVDLSLTGGVNAKKPSDPAKPVSVQIDLAPAAFVAQAHQRDLKCKIEEGVLRMKGHGALIEIDAATGRLIRAAEQDAFHTLRWSISVAPRRLEQAAAEVRKLAADDRDDHDPRRPLNTLVASMVCDVAHLLRAWDGDAAPGDRRGLAVWQGLLAAYFLPDIDAFLGEGADQSGEEHEYVIPATPAPPDRPHRHENALSIATLPLAWCQELFPAEAWPCRLSRATVHYCLGDEKRTHGELTRVLESESTGPLGYAVSAYMSTTLEPATASHLAKRGLERLSLDHFRRDYELLIQSRAPWVKSVLAGLDQLRRLPPDDVDAAVAVLPPLVRRFVGDVARRLRREPDVAVDVALSAELDAAWTSRWQYNTKLILRLLADQPPPQPASATARGRGKMRTR